MKKTSQFAKLYKTNNEIIDVLPKDGRYFSLEEMQAFVGGRIEIVGTPQRRVMIVNETARLEGFPVNENATRLFVPDGNLNSVRYPIVGDALVCDEGFLER